MIEGTPPSAREQEPIVVGSMEEMFRHMRERPLVALPADDPKYDSNFPDHPLSLVRHQMAAILAGLVVNEPPDQCLPYRVEVMPVSTLAPATPTASHDEASIPAAKKQRPWWKFS